MLLLFKGTAVNFNGKLTHIKAS